MPWKWKCLYGISNGGALFIRGHQPHLLQQLNLLRTFLGIFPLTSVFPESQRGLIQSSGSHAHQTTDCLVHLGRSLWQVQMRLLLLLLTPWRPLLENHWCGGSQVASLLARQGKDGWKAPTLLDSVVAQLSILKCEEQQATYCWGYKDRRAQRGKRVRIRTLQPPGSFHRCSLSKHCAPSPMCPGPTSHGQHGSFYSLEEQAVLWGWMGSRMGGAKLRLGL